MVLSLGNSVVMRGEERQPEARNRIVSGKRLNRVGGKKVSSGRRDVLGSLVGEDLSRRYRWNRDGNLKGRALGKPVKQAWVSLLGLREEL